MPKVNLIVVGSKPRCDCWEISWMEGNIKQFLQIVLVRLQKSNLVVLGSSSGVLFKELRRRKTTLGNSCLGYVAASR